MSRARGFRTPPPRLGSLPWPERPSCPPRTGSQCERLRDLLSLQHGGRPAGPRCFGPRLPPGPAISSRSAMVLGGRSGRRPVSWRRFRLPGLCPRRAGACGSECGLVSLTETLGDAAGDESRRTSGAFGRRRRLAEPLNTLASQPRLPAVHAALLLGWSLTSSKLEAGSPLHFLVPLATCHLLRGQGSLRR